MDFFSSPFIIFFWFVFPMAVFLTIRQINKGPTHVIRWNWHIFDQHVPKRLDVDRIHFIKMNKMKHVPLTMDRWLHK